MDYCLNFPLLRFVETAVPTVLCLFTVALENPGTIVAATDTLELCAEEEGGGLVLAAELLREPVAHDGPFVMNTAEEIQ